MTHTDGTPIATGWPAGLVIEALAGTGGTASVYRARRTDGTRVALKVLSAELSAMPEVLQRFRAEADVMRALDHPGIARVLGCGSLADGRPYLLLEWLEGRDLAAELEARVTLSPREAIDVLAQIVPALSAAHAQGIVHRDLKPSNVLVLAGEGLRCKLLDFGIAKLTDRSHPAFSELTRTGLRLGTPAYMAPEQLRAELVDARADLYALGVMLFELLTGRLPFDAETDVELEILQLEAPPPRPSRFAAIPPWLDAVVLRCLAKAPAERYPSATALLDDLRAAATATGFSEELRIRLDVRLTCPTEEAPEEALDDLDRVHAALVSLCGEAHLGIVTEAAGMLLARAELSAHPPLAEVERAAALRAITTGLEQLASRPGRSPLVALSALADQAGRDAAWPGPAPRPGAHITRRSLPSEGWTVVDP